MMVVADTNFLIDLMNRRPLAVEKLGRLQEAAQPVWIPAPALHELYYGASLHARADRELRRVEAIERALPPVPFDAAAARAAGVAEAELERRGKRPNGADLQIGAIAAVLGEPVVTRDEAFPSLKGLRIERY